MAGSGELYKGDDGTWAFRVKASNGKVVATDGGPPGHKAKADARAVLQKLLKGDYNGPIREPAAVTCGQVITANTTLTGDLTCTEGPALIVAADNVVLDLGGFTISGHGAASAGAPGILLRNVKGVTVRKGTIAHFGAGIAIAGGANNVVQNVTVQDNVGEPDGDFGDGITMSDSSGNRIQGNVVRRNGPFSGISMVGACSDNTIQDNVVSDNNMLPGDPSVGRQDMGIRIEGPAADNNVVTGNTVTGSGADGIVVLPTCANPQGSCAGTPGNNGNQITKNMSHKNGTSGNGSGIRLFSVAQPVAPMKATVTDNVTNDNVTNGVSVDKAGSGTPGPTEHNLSGNSGTGNGQFDGFDGNTPACGSNAWAHNTFARVNQPCVSAPNPAGLTERTTAG
ncbi:MAG: right-handed parallel beta-helix repeat-containing protein [Actinomycetota bacterium]|nr:right-handed parallel beta-helix repeat-containing protein [Actinomycetota bacterium]